MSEDDTMELTMEILPIDNDQVYVGDMEDMNGDGDR